jgi:hypothetical protein
LQQRLPPVLRRAGVLTKEAANVYLREIYVPVHNARFGKPAAEPGSAFVAYAGAALDEVLSLQEDHQVGRDNCLSWSGLSLQIPASCTGAIMCRRRLACMNIPIGGWRCSMVHAASPVKMSTGF